MAKVFMTHVRKAKMCSRGARAFFIKNKLDWNDFLRNGIDEAKLLETGDAMALQVVEIARGEV